MKEIDFDAPDEGVIDFEDLKQTEVGTPLKKEPIAKPKTGFNINFRDLEDVVAALTAAEMQMLNTLIELRKLDNLASRAKILSELDTSKILEQLDKVGFTQIARKITDSLKTELETQKKEIYTSSAAIETAAKDLSAKAENLRLTSDSLMQIDNMSDHLQEVASSIKKWRNKSMFIAIGLSLFFGLASGAIVSNINTILSPESIQNAQILKAKFGEIVALRDEQNTRLYYLAIPEHQKIKEVVSFVQDNTRYIKIEAK